MSANNPRRNPINYELRWVVIGIVVLAVLLGLSIWRMMAAPGRIPSTPQEASIPQILASPMFKHPGVVRLGPHHYRVAIIARQFQFDPAKIVVPVNARIDFYVTSADVIHGFELPGTDVNVESFPGYVAHVFATFRTPHKYLTVCDQYCGIGHQNMVGEFDVVAHLPPAHGAQTAAMTPNAPDAFAQAGKKIYAAHCEACHQANGAGLAGAFPPLVKSVPEYMAKPTGRTVLADVMLYGLAGKVKAEGKTYNGTMPAWGGQLSNRQIAEVLDYITTSWGNDQAEPPAFQLYKPAEIKAARAKTMTAKEVWQARAKLSSSRH